MWRRAEVIVRANRWRSTRVVQPWGSDKGRQATLQSEHATVAEAFAALDAISVKMVRTGTPSNAIELVVVDETGSRWIGLIATSRHIGSNRVIART